MRKLFCSIVILAALAATFVSCQKEEDFSNGPIFEAVLESSAKTEFHTDDRTFTWKGNDRIHIWDGNGNHKRYQPTSADGTRTTISPVGTYMTLGLEPNHHYTAIYPDFFYDTTISAPSSNNPVVINIPATQNVTNQVDDPSTLHLGRFPMYCESSNQSLHFKNLCGAIQLHLQRANSRVNRIRFTAGENDPQVCGRYTIDWNGGEPTITPDPDNHEHSVVLEYAQAVPITSATDFWLSLPAGSYLNFRIEITCIEDDGTQGTISFGGNGTKPLVITRNYVIPIQPNLGAGGARFRGQGSFTVELDDNKTPTKKVYISPGNLQYVDNHWQFASKQYEVLHGYSGDRYTTSSSNFRQDLFGWSTEQSRYGKNLNASDYVDGSLYTPFVDWGNLLGASEAWYTMPVQEWEVLLLKRPTKFNYNGQTVRFAGATIGSTKEIKHNLRYSTVDYWENGIRHIYNPNITNDFEEGIVDHGTWTEHVIYFKNPREKYDYISTDYDYQHDGILVFPDNFTAEQWNECGATLPSGAINNMGCHPDIHGYNADGMVFLTMEQFRALESKGVIWLPATGKAHINGSIYAFDRPNNTSSAALYYWTASPYDYMRTTAGEQTNARGNVASAFQFYVQNNGGAYAMCGQSRTDRCAVRLVRQAPLN